LLPVAACLLTSLQDSFPGSVNVAIGESQHQHVVTTDWGVVFAAGRVGRAGRSRLSKNSAVLAGFRYMPAFAGAVTIPQGRRTLLSNAAFARDQQPSRAGRHDESCGHKRRRLWSVLLSGGSAAMIASARERHLRVWFELSHHCFTDWTGTKKMVGATGFEFESRSGVFARIVILPA